MIYLAPAIFRFTIKNWLVTPQHLVNLFERDSTLLERGWPWLEGLGNGSCETKMELAEKRKTKSKSLEEEVLRKKEQKNNNKKKNEKTGIL